MLNRREFLKGVGALLGIAATAPIARKLASSEVCEMLNAEEPPIVMVKDELVWTEGVYSTACCSTISGVTDKEDWGVPPQWSWPDDELASV